MRHISLHLGKKQRRRKITKFLMIFAWTKNLPVEPNRARAVYSVGAASKRRVWVPVSTANLRPSGENRSQMPACGSFWETTSRNVGKYQLIRNGKAES
jgi:hypothetical protein